jgi:hypothetical protein
VLYSTAEKDEDFKKINNIVMSVSYAILSRSRVNDPGAVSPGRSYVAENSFNMSRSWSETEWL